MRSNPAECLYCQNNETLHNLMIEIASLSVSRVFLFKEQTYKGRCLVAYKDHVNDLFELSDEERNAFMADVVRVTKAMDQAFHPEKITVKKTYKEEQDLQVRGVSLLQVPEVLLFPFEQEFQM